MRALCGAIITAGALIGLGLTAFGIGTRYQGLHQQDPQGNQYGFHGVFHGDPSLDAIVQTFEFEGAPGHVCLQTVTFAERGDATLMRTVMAFQSVEDRDQMVASDMERGVRDSGDRLDELFAKLAAA